MAVVRGRICCRDVGRHGDREVVRCGFRRHLVVMYKKVSRPDGTGTEEERSQDDGGSVRGEIGLVLRRSQRNDGRMFGRNHEGIPPCAHT